LDLAAVPAVYFSACKKSEYVIDHRTSKILIENCDDCVIEINGKILTACVEIWKCKNVHLKLNTKVKTLQADIMAGLKIVYATAGDMQSIVWQDVDNIDIGFADNSTPQLLTGHAHMQEVDPDSDMKIDQFIIRFVQELGPGLQPERCVRLKNGFLSTEREAADWDQRNEKARDLFVENFLKEGGIHLNKDKNATKKIPPNSICACGSKKKYKNCCSNKKAITGLHDTQKPKVYVQDKSGVKVETKENDAASAMSALAITDSTAAAPVTAPQHAPTPEAKLEAAPSTTAPSEPKPAKKAAKSKKVKKPTATPGAAPAEKAKVAGEPATKSTTEVKAADASAPLVKCVNKGTPTTISASVTQVADDTPVVIHGETPSTAATKAPRKKKVVKQSGAEASAK